MYENVKNFETTFCGRPLVVETGKYAPQANGAVMVRYGETVLMCAATASSKPRDGIDFLPLSVDFDEKLYAVGKIPGSFMKREGRPSEKAILASRVIDRPVRPLFPKDLRNDVALLLTVMSVDADCSPEVVGLVGASIALSISDIPWNGPVSSVIAGLVDGKVVLNPTAEQRKVSDMAVTVASSAKKVVMIEAGANEVDDDTMFNAIMTAHEENQKIVKFINEIVAEIGKPKFDYPSANLDETMYNDIKDFCIEKVKVALDTDDKTVRDAAMAKITDEVVENFSEKYPDSVSLFGEAIYKIQKYVVRRWLLDEGKRVDGRGLRDMRPLYAEVGILPRTHGSGLFSRGQTQVLTTLTLGALKEQQLLDGIDDEEYKRYMHHYNMPGYSVGEAKPSRSPGRREIGHGALAQRALEPVIPSEEEFPYAMRLVSEVLSSNGSTSQGSICGSTLALMDAGVPIKAPVAGISCGLVTEGDRHLTFTDIQGIEDFYGDMDFKVGGTKKGITAIQMDLKIDGLTPEIIKEAFEKTHVARDYIIDEVILKAISAPRDHLSKYAPKMLRTSINPDKIRDVIGKGGCVIQKLCADYDVKIDIDDDGNVFIGAVDAEKGEQALKMVELIASDPQVGETYTGVVIKIIEGTGAIVEYAPGKDGLCHISELDFKRTEKVEDVVGVGDTILVKVIRFDKDKGRTSLSRKAALADLQAKADEE